MQWQHASNQCLLQTSDQLIMAKLCIVLEVVAKVYVQQGVVTYVSPALCDWDKN